MEKVIESFIPQGGKHCITNALKQIFTFYGYPMSEEMLFGIASGLSFIYINQSQSPMINGRTKIFDFEQKLAQRLHIKIACKSGKDYSRILNKTKQLIDTKNPVLVYVDMPYLQYLGLPASSHFGGHAVVLFGYDDDTHKFWISDRDQHDHPIRVPSGESKLDYHLVDYEELERARRSAYRPFPANCKYLMFDFNGCQAIHKDLLKEAILETCNDMLFPPAHLLGINGIKKFAKEIMKWKKFDIPKLHLAGTTNYFQIHQDGGTGGGLFRKMYGEFLIEAATIMEDGRITKLGIKFVDISMLWDALAADMWTLSLSDDTCLLDKMAVQIWQLYDIEKALFTTLRELVKHDE